MTYIHTYICQLHNYIKRPAWASRRDRLLQRTLQHGHARHLLFVRGGGHQDIACVRLRGCCASTCTVHMSFACNSTNNVSHAALASWYFTTAFFSVYRKQKGRQSNVLYNEVADGRRRRSERSGTPFRPTPFGTFRGNGQLSCSHGHDKLYHTRVTVSKFFLTALPEPCRCHMYVLVFF